MRKSRIIFGLVVILVIAACGGGGGGMQGGGNSLAGIYRATYLAGDMLMDVRPDGSVAIAVNDNGLGTFSGTGTLSGGGALTGQANKGNQVITVSGSVTETVDGPSFSGNLSGAVNAPVSGQYISTSSSNPFKGTWSGTFNGGASGSWTATVAESGAISATANDGFDTYQLSGQVTNVGVGSLSGTGAGGGLSITFQGQFTFGQGTIRLGNGSWTSSAPGTGSWTGRRNKMPSGPEWVNEFPGSKSLTTLSGPFRTKVTSFMQAMENAGLTTSIQSTFRPAERAYLMHYSWKIAKGQISPAAVPPMNGVEIEWNHAQATSAAQAMVTAFGINPTLQVAPSLTSRHQTGDAIDVNISWTGTPTIKNFDGSDTVLTGTPKDHTNATLIGVGATYGVIHFQPVAADKNHWSTDGHRGLPDNCD